MAEGEVGAAAPVVPVAPAADAAPVLDPTAGQESETPEGETKPVARERVKFDEEQQKEVDRIVAKTRAQESRRLERVAKAEAEAAHYKRLHEESQRPAQQPQDGAPKQEDFKDYEKWLIATAKWELKQDLAARDKETAAETQHREALGRAEKMREKLARGSEKYDDFDEVVRGDVPFTHPMVAFLEESDIADELAYKLAQSGEAARIAKLSPAGQFRELVKFEAKLQVAPKPTQTPPPIKPNGTNASAQTGYRPDMSDKAYAEWRNRQKAQRDR